MDSAISGLHLPAVAAAVTRPDRLQGIPPIEVAAALAHLPGFVFFDTAGHLPSRYHAPFSILAARPVRTFHGSLHFPQDLEMLRQALDAGAAASGEGPGFPAGGLCGYAGYLGDFVFGDYPEMLVYDHSTGVWHETGSLSREFRSPSNALPVPASVGAFTPLSRAADFIHGVERAQEWIAAGDIYQVNLSQAFVAPVSGPSLFPLYDALRRASPAPVAAYLSLGGREILSSSPETFLRFSGRTVETRPIKGTRPRFADPEEDRRSACELQSSAKEMAELVMITDLLRNDLGQVCDFGSVEVSEMLQLETLGQVHHLVSTIRGRLAPGVDHLGALAAAFPGGSITGAPKKRAMEIIAALESVPRGIYCGALGYLGYHGESQFNIAIRTLVREGETLTYHVGAGIVADSDPQKEYEETLHKAAGIRLAVDRWLSSGPG